MFRCSLYKVIKLREYICGRYGKIDLLTYLITEIKKPHTLFKQCAGLKLTVMKRYIIDIFYYHPSKTHTRESSAGYCEAWNATLIL